MNATEKALEVRVITSRTRITRRFEYFFSFDAHSRASDFLARNLGILEKTQSKLLHLIKIIKLFQRANLGFDFLHLHQPTLVYGNISQSFRFLVDSV